MPKVLDMVDNLISRIETYQNTNTNSTVTKTTNDSKSSHTEISLQRRIHECKGNIELSNYDSVSKDISKNNLTLENSGKQDKVIKLYANSKINENLDLDKDCLISSTQDMLDKMDVVDHGGNKSKTKWVVRDGNLYVASHAPWRQPKESGGDEKKKIHHLEFNIKSVHTIETDIQQGSVFCGGELKVDKAGKVTSLNIDCSYSKENGKGEYKQQAKENGYASLLHLNKLGLLPDNLANLTIG